MKNYLDIALKRFLGERVFFNGPIETQYYSEPVDIVVLENPTHAEFLALIGQSARHALRATLDGSTLYVWDASIAIHGDIRDSFGITGCEMTLRTDLVAINGEAGEPSDDELRALADQVHNSRAIKRAMGADMKVVFE